MRDGFTGEMDWNTNVIGLDVTDVNVEIEASGDPSITTVLFLLGVTETNQRLDPARLPVQVGGAATHAGPAPGNPDHLLYRSTMSLASLDLLQPDADLEVAVVVREGGTSDQFLLNHLGRGWPRRGRAVQPPPDAPSDRVSGDANELRPDAKRLFQCGGARVIVASTHPESGPVRFTARLVRDPADLFYYSGHGLEDGCIAIGPLREGSSEYTCWATADDIVPSWATTDVDYVIFAGCSVLRVDFDDQGVQVPGSRGLAWARMLGADRVQLLFGYQQKAPKDDGQGGNDIAALMGSAFRKSRDRKDLIDAWFDANAQNGAWSAIVMEYVSGTSANYTYLIPNGVETQRGVRKNLWRTNTRTLML